MMSIYYSNKIVLENEIMDGYIQVENARIVHIERGTKPSGEFVDLSDQWLLPGFVNIHSRNYFAELQSKYNKLFAPERIFCRVDKNLAEAGVTTNFHTVHLEELLKESSVEQTIRLLKDIREGIFRKSLVNHKIHLIFRLGEKLANKNLRELINSETIDFITCVGLYDRDVFNYRNQYFVQSLQYRFDLDDDEATEALRLLIELREQSALDELSYRIKSTKGKKLPFASSRFSLIRKLKDEYKIDIGIVSGDHTPQTIEKIRDSHVHYAYDIENYIRSSNPKELSELLGDGVIKIITASSRPGDILEYIFAIEKEVGLTEAVKLFSTYPAEASCLSDRGAIAVGKRADFVAVSLLGEHPILTKTVSGGRIVVEYNY